MRRTSLLAMVVAVPLVVSRDPGSTPLKLRGPLVQWLGFRPVSLAECRLDTVMTFSPPFWRAPYYWCTRRLGSREESLQIDADSVVVMTDAMWQVAAQQGQDEFARTERALRSKLGRPQRRCKSLAVVTGRAAPPSQRRRECCNLSAEWFASDTLQASLALSHTTDMLYFGVPG